MLETLLLGRFDLKLDGSNVSLSSRKSQALIAHLALEGSTSRGHLAFLLWSDAGEEAARRNLRQELWQLQKTAFGAQLVLEGDQVMLLAGFGLDSNQFQTLLETNRRGEALGLYRGPLLEGFVISGAAAFEEWLEVKREFFASMRRTALAQEAGALELAGDLRGALAAHLALLLENALLEVHQRDAMRLLTLLGDPALALERFEQFKNLLHQELNLEPLGETVRLAERIRTSQTLESSPVRQVMATEPALNAPLVGRDTAWATLEQAKAGLSLVLGVPGVGKTRLVEEFAHSTAGAVWFRAREVASETPFYPIAEALRVAFENPATRPKLEALEPIWLAEVARLLPELATSNGLTSSEPPSPEGRTRFLEGLSRAVLAISEPRGLIVFDDLHWADASSLELFAHLLERHAQTASSPRMIATARELELEQNQAVQTLFRGLRRSEKLQEIVLEKFSEAQTLQLVQGMSGGSSATLFSRRLFAATSGNPLFLLQTIRHLFEIGTLFANEHGWNTAIDETTSDYAELSIPKSVPAAVLERVTHLGDTARRVLEAASLAEDGFGLEMLLGATALSDWEGIEALERLTATNLLLPIEPGESYRFSHELVRRTLEDSLGPERKRILHKRLAQTLEDAGGSPSAIARHLEAAGKRAAAAGWRIKAAEAAASVYAYREALEQYDHVLEQQMMDEAAFSIRQARMRLWWALGNADERLVELELLSMLATHLRNKELETQVLFARVGLYADSGQYQDVLQITASLLELTVLTQAQIVEALFLSGAALLRLGMFGQAENHLYQAETLARVCLPERLSSIYLDLRVCALSRGDIPLARLYNAQALQACRVTINRGDELDALTAEGRMAGMVGEHAKALKLLEHALQESLEVGHIPAQGYALACLASVHLSLGQLTAANERIQTSLNLGRENQKVLVYGVLYNLLARSQHLNGRLDLALESNRIAKEFNRQSFEIGSDIRSRLILAELHLDLGLPLEAREELSGSLELIEREDLRSYRAPVENLLARCDLMLLEPTQALKRLEQISEFDRWSEWCDLAETSALTGFAHLMTDAASTALQTVIELGGTPVTDSWATRVRLLAGKMLGDVPPELFNDARALLRSVDLPKLPALELRRDLATVLESSEPTEARSLHDEVQHAVLEMAQTLPTELKAGFLERWLPA